MFLEVNLLCLKFKSFWYSFWVPFHFSPCVRVCCVLSCFSHVGFCVSFWTVACQAPLSMGTLQARILEWVAVPFSRHFSSKVSPNSHLVDDPLFTGVTQRRTTVLQIVTVTSAQQAEFKKCFSLISFVPRSYFLLKQILFPSYKWKKQTNKTLKLEKIKWFVQDLTAHQKFYVSFNYTCSRHKEEMGCIGKDKFNRCNIKNLWWLEIEPQRREWHILWVD